MRRIDWSREGRALVVALGLLTRVPMRIQGNVDARTLGYSLHWYPAAGLLIGLSLALLGTVVTGLLGAVLIVAVWVALTGALHLDGLADCADAWVGGMGDRERTLAIMKDPACGPMGVSAVVLVLLLKMAALETLLTHSGPMAAGWWLAPMLARALVPLAFLSLPYVRQGGMGDGLAAQASRTGIALAVLATVGLLAWCTTVMWCALWLLVAAALFVGWRRTVRRRLGGFTGDCAGALVELAETALLVTSALIIAAGTA